MRHTFTIYGSQESLDANPIPYHRTTQGSFWNKGSKRYAAWKQYVRLAAGKCFEGTPRGEVRTEIYFGKENHADSDNIIKGILDALFENDKEMDVFTIHTCCNKEPKVVVTIDIAE